jgi:prepilin peptidase CpaA
MRRKRIVEIHASFGLRHLESQNLVNKLIWALSAAFALTAGITDLRWRRIPNWLTYTAIPLAICLHAIAEGWRGTRLSLLGAALGLGILLPFVLIRSLGGGDWKLVGGLGAFFGPHRLIEVLIYTLLINGVMALCMIIWKKRLGQTFRNLGRMFAAFFKFHLPGQDLTIDNPEAVKVPFGVAAAIAVLLYTAFQRSWTGF